MIIIILLVIAIIAIIVMRGRQKPQPAMIVYQPGPQDCSIDPQDKNDIQLCYPDDLTTERGRRNCCNHKKGGAEGVCNYCEYSVKDKSQMGKCLTDNDFNKARCA